MWVCSHCGAVLGGGDAYCWRCLVWFDVLRPRSEGITLGTSQASPGGGASRVNRCFPTVGVPGAPAPAEPTGAWAGEVYADL